MFTDISQISENPFDKKIGTALTSVSYERFSSFKSRNDGSDFELRVHETSFKKLQNKHNEKFHYYPMMYFHAYAVTHVLEFPTEKDKALPILHMWKNFNLILKNSFQKF